MNFAEYNVKDANLEEILLALKMSSTPPQGFRSTKTPTPTCVTTSGRSSTGW